MSENIFTPGPTPNSVRSADGKVLTAPDGWILLPPGDAALTRRVKAAGDHWVVAEIPRVKGKRRQVRRMLAQRSKDLLGRYRKGESVGEERPLKKALAGGK